VNERLFRRRAGMLHATWGGIALFASVFVLASCGERSDVMNSPVSTTPTRPSVWSIDSRLSGERFSSAKATSSCSGSAGIFQVSGKARGPFPGTFTARGKLSDGLIFHERFEIRFGSGSISGSAGSAASGTPSAGCSKSGKLSFDFPILQYRTHHPKASGMGHASLFGANFTQGFE
jgi:hypothetical protein